MTIVNREHWLCECANYMRPRFKAAGYDIPDLNVSCGYPTMGEGSDEERVLGQCLLLRGRNIEIFIHPILYDSLEVATVLCHELVHAVLYNKYGHTGKFITISKAIGLRKTPKKNMSWKDTSATQELEQFICGFLHKHGFYPHGSYFAEEFHLFVAQCEQCGYIAGQMSGTKRLRCPMCKNRPLLKVS